MEKAVIRNYYLKKRTAGSELLNVQFNPETYSIDEHNSYSIDGKNLNGSGENRLRFSFLELQPSVLSVELFFDSYVYKKSGPQQDVREKFSMLRRLMLVQAGEHTPDGVQFAWGSFIFVGVVTSLKENYTMFSETGVPVRCKVTLSISGCREVDLAAQPNESPDRTKLRTLKQKETLWDLAAQEYGSGEMWRVIAKANGIENPRKLEGASKLILPALTDGE